MSTKCAAITRNGQPCKGLVRPGNDYCPAHDPGRREARRRAASKAGKSKPGREIAEIKGQLRAVIADVISGGIQKDTGSIAFQGYNTLLKALELERKIKEATEFEERLEELEKKVAGYDTRERSRWHR